MTTKCLLSTGLTVALAVGPLVGCAQQPEGTPPSSSAESRPVFVEDNEPANVTALRISGGDEPADQSLGAVDDSPSPELALAIRRGVPAPVSLVGNRPCRSDFATADLRVRLEVQLGQQARLRELIEMSKESEEQFLQRFGIGGVGPGESADLQLRMYEAVRERLQKQLAAAKLDINKLREKIARLSGGRENSIRLGDKTMPEKPLAQCGFSAAQVAKLDGLGIRTARDFVLQFYLPEQHEAAAALLGVEQAEAQRLLREAAKEVPEDELDELVREARRPHEFGVLPPDLDKETPQ